MAPVVLRGARHLLPRPRGGRRRDDEPGVPAHHQPSGRGRRAGADGARRSSCSWARSPVPTSTRRCASRSALRGDFPWWRVPGYIVAQLGGACLAAWFLQAVDPRVLLVRVELPGHGLQRGQRVRHGGRPDLRSGQRDPRDGVGRPEPGRDRRARRGWLHRAGRVVGQPDLRRVDEPGPHVRPGRDQRGLRLVLGVRRRPARRRGRSPWASPSCSAAEAAAWPGPAPPRATSTPRSHGPVSPRQQAAPLDAGTPEVFDAGSRTPSRGAGPCGAWGLDGCAGWHPNRRRTAPRRTVPRGQTL